MAHAIPPSVRHIINQRYINMKALRQIIAILILTIAVVPAAAEVPMLKTDAIYSISAIKINDTDARNYEAALCYTQSDGKYYIMVVPDDESNRMTLEVPMKSWYKTTCNGHPAYEAKYDFATFTVYRVDDEDSILMIETEKNLVLFLYGNEPITYLE